MNYFDLSIEELHKAILKNEVTPKQLVIESIKLAKEDNNNAFEYISEKEALEQVEILDEKDKNNLLWGIPFVMKDNFSTKDIPTTASSDILNGYIPVFSSEVYLRLRKQGAILIGKTTLDELAMGGSGTTGHKGKTYNPYDPTHTHQIGGSSCGSAACCASGIVPLAIGSDTGDSVRKPASYGGLVGFKPTWGRISRYGLFPFAPSLDHVAYFTRSVKDSASILTLLAGRDDKDSTSSNEPVIDYSLAIDANIKGKRVAVIQEILDTITDSTIKATYLKTLTNLESEGATIDYVHMDMALLNAIYPAYIVISCAEATSNNANLDGIKFGQRVKADDYESIVFNSRTKGFSELIKRRFVIGSYSLLKENQQDTFIKAQKVRRLIVNAVNDILKDNDCIYLPASPTTAPCFDANSDRLSPEYLVADNYLAIANFGGLPSITLPIGFKDGFPFGGNITCKKFDEANMFSLASALENKTGLKNLSTKGGKR